MFSKERVQRFSIRKLTVGVASVLIGMSFMTKMSTNKVYADSAQVVNERVTLTNSENQNGGVTKPADLIDSKHDQTSASKTSEDTLVEKAEAQQNQEQEIKPEGNINDVQEGHNTLEDTEQTEVNKDNWLQRDGSENVATLNLNRGNGSQVTESLTDSALSAAKTESNTSKFIKGMYQRQNISVNDDEAKQLVDFAKTLSNGETLNSYLFDNTGTITTDYLPLMKLITDDKDIQDGKLPIAENSTFERDISFTFPKNYELNNSDQIQKVNFQRFYTRIKVNTAKRRIIGKSNLSNWMVDQDTLSNVHLDKDSNAWFDEVEIPQIEGYRSQVTTSAKDFPNQSTSSKIKTVKIDPNNFHATISVKVEYSSLSQHTVIKFVDDDNDEEPVKNDRPYDLSKFTDATTSVNPANLEIPTGYELAKGQSNPIEYTFKAKDNPSIIIHLVHKIMEITPDTPSENIPANLDVDPDDLIKKANLTVNYKNNDGTDFTAQIPENHTQTLTFKGKAYYDLVTCKLVNAKYVQDAKITVRYLDGSKNFKILDQKVVEGEIGDKINYDVNTKIQEYKNMGYALNSNGYTAGDTFTEDNNGKTYDIIFRHASTPVTPDNPNFSSSLFTNLVAVPSSTSATEIPGRWVLDTDNHDEPKIHWDYDTQSFTKVISPNEDHYYVKEITSDDKEDHHNGNDVDVIKVNRDDITSPHNTKSITLTVTYAPKRKINVKFIDDTTKQELNDYSKIFDEAKPGDSLNGYTTNTSIAALKAKNYVLVSDGFTDAKLNNQMPDEDNTYEVHLIHVAMPKPDTKKVNLNVTYQAEDGSNFNRDAPKEAHQTVEFRGTHYVDAVTGKLANVKQLNGKWVVDSDNTATPATKWNDETKSFAKAISPQKDHYYVANITSDDQINHRTGDDVDEIDGLTHDSNDINVVVRYALKHNINVHYIDDNPTEQQDLSSYDRKLEAKPGDALNYTTATTLKTLEAKGYKLEDGVGKGDQFTAAMLDGKMPNVNGVYNVYLVHTTTTVTPKKPGTPGQPIDPKNPDGPKYPDGTDENSLKRTGIQIVHYVGAGDQTPKDDKKSFDFTRMITFDNVTGKIIETTPWNPSSHTFDIIKTPVITGYYADKANAGGTKITPDNLNKKVIVTYKPIGCIIPVDPNGKQIPDAPTPQFPNDPKDPTNVIPGEKPTVTGYHPENGKPGDPVDPILGNPGKDINVPYVKDQGSVKVIYHDDTFNIEIPGTEYNSNSLDAGTPITYPINKTINNLQTQGYMYVSTDRAVPTEIIGNENIVVTVHMKHGTKPVNPDNPTDKYTKADLQKSVRRVINYVDSQSNKIADSVITTVVFTAKGTVDTVTGNLVNLNPDGSIKDQNGKFIWTYSVHDGDIEDESLDNVKSGSAYKFTKTAEKKSIDANGFTYNFDSVDPADYDAGNGAVSEYNVDATKGLSDLIVNVYYQRVEKGSVQVVFKDGTTNSIIKGVGYNSSIKNEGTKIDYTTSQNISDLKNQGYVYVSTDGTVPTAIIGNQNIVVTVHMKHGVQPVTPTTPSKNIPKTPEGKQVVDPNTLTKKVNLTVNYVNSDGSTFTGAIPNNATQTVTFTGIAYVDKITGQLVNAKLENGQWVIDDSNTVTPQITWTSDKTSFDKVISPIEQNYHLISVSAYQDGNDVAAIAGLTKDSENINVTVTYAPNGKIIPVDPNHNPIQNVPQPQYPTDPKDPSKVTPDEPVPNVPGYTPSTPTVTPTDPAKDTPVIYHPDVQDQTVTIKYIDDATGDAHTDLSSYNKSITAKPGAVLNYSTQPSITELENKGYVLVSDNFNVTTMPEKGGSYEVHLNHKTTTITPGKPGHPDEPINPNDPDPKGPKWPQGTDAKSLTKDGSEIIHYVYSDGKPAAKDSVQNTQFEHTLVFDNVTGKQIEDKGWSPESHKFNDITSPTINGYHADKATVKGATVTLDNPTNEIPVVYTKNSETVKANGTVTYIDDETGKILRTDKLAGNVGEKIVYTTQDKIDEFNREGYKLVSNDFQDGQEVFAKEDNNFVVHLKKALAPQPNPHKDDPTPQSDPEPQPNPDHDDPKPNMPKGPSSQPPKNEPQDPDHKNDQPEKPFRPSNPKQKPYTQVPNKSDKKKALKESKKTLVVKKYVNKSIKKVVSHKKAAKTEKIETKTSTKIVSNDPKVAAKTAERRAMIQGNDKKLPQTGEGNTALSLIGLMIVSLTGISIFAIDRKRN